MRPASDVERRRLNDTFADLVRIRSVSGEEAAMAQRVAGELRSVGVEVEQPDAGRQRPWRGSRGAAIAR